MEAIHVAFEPSDMTFSPVARLTIHGVGPIDVENLVVYHISDDGEVGEPPFTVTVDGGEWEITVEVPGFSEYTWEDEEADEDE